MNSYMRDVEIFGLKDQIKARKELAKLPQYILELRDKIDQFHRNATINPDCIYCDLTQLSEKAQKLNKYWGLDKSNKKGAKS